MTVILEKPQRSARKAKGDGHLRRAEILRAAEQIFMREGYQGATIRKIAEEVGVSSTALYMHFRDKDEILLEICQCAVATLLACNTEIASRPIDAVSRVRLMLEAYMRFGLENPSTYRLAFCFTPPQMSGDGRKAASDLGERCYQLFRDSVAEIAVQGRLQHGGIDSAAKALWAAAHGLVTLCITQRIHGPEELMSVLLDSLFTGLVVR